MRKVLFVIPCILVLPVMTLAQPGTGALSKKIDQLFMARYSRTTPGVAVAVLRHNQVVYAKGFGAANLEYGVPITPHTVFDIASLSKQFTAFAMATLAHAGKLSLDDTVRKYVPELPAYGPAITIRHLLMHSSGLRDQNDLLNLSGWREGDIVTNGQIQQLIFAQQGLNFTPGQQFSYSNSGYTLLALILERITKQPFPAWIRQHIFEPLGMQHSFFIADNGEIIKDKAYSYAKGETGFRKIPFNSTNTGARGLQATVDDLCKWVLNFQIQHVGREVMADMNTAPVTTYRQKYHYGQAFSQYRGVKLIEHDGADAGYRTYIGRFPEQGLAVIVLGNIESLNPRNTALLVADIYLQSLLPAGAPAPTVPEQEKVFLPDRIEQGLEGQYRLPDGRIMTIWADDHAMRYMLSGDSLAYYFRRDATALLRAPELNATASYKEGRIGEVDSLVYTVGGVLSVLPKTFVDDPASKQLLAYTGTYYSEELDVTYTVRLHHNTLQAILPRGTVVSLRQRGPGLYGGSYYWIKQFRFTRDASNAVTGFEVSAGRSSGIRFRKANPLPGLPQPAAPRQ